MTQNIAVVGAGISGMASAYILRKKGHSVTIFADKFSPVITSNKAAAFWFPYHIRNDVRGIGWCNTSYRYYRAFSENIDTGISMQQLLKVLRKGVAEEEPIWKDFMPANSFTELSAGTLPPGIAKIYDIQVPLIETQLFLPWLQQQLEKEGVSFIQKKVERLDELTGNYDVVINCSALGARTICNDREVIPVRGQVALLAPGPAIPIYLDNEKPLYIVPRKDAIIVGGTYEPGEESEVTEPATLEQILKNAYEVYPELAHQAVIGSWAGLRPYRADVRVEPAPGENIIHNYGHGGSGFTLAFGCAESVGQMVDEI